MTDSLCAEGYQNENLGEPKTKEPEESSLQAGVTSLESSIAGLDISASDGSGTPIPQCSHNYFPYADSSFVSIRERKQFWKDNTRHIANTVESYSRHQMFLRPPRWGKSLFIDMLYSYLDINAACNFEELFKGTEIYGMERHHNNQYYVMLLDLSIDIGVGDPATIEARLYERVDNAVEDFCERYRIDRKELGSRNALATFERAVRYVENRKEGRVFILIDEYDRFANKLMFENPDAFNKVVAGQSGDPASSPVRAMFEAIKSLKQVRSFTVGLSPIALTDASGVNFIDDISEVPAVGDLLGLTEKDFRSALNKIFGSEVDIGPLVELMKLFYNGYLYDALTRSGLTSPLYHTQLCLYFFQKLCRQPEFRKRAFTGQVTLEEMIDKNTGISENVINLLIRQNEFAGIIAGLANGCPILTQTVPSFRLREMLAENSASPDLLVSFMRWHGLLTMTPDKSGYVIPNRVVGDAKGLLSDVIDAMNAREYNIRTVINEPSDQAIWELHQAAFNDMGTRFDNSVSEVSIVGILEGIWGRQGRREGLQVFVEKDVGSLFPDLIFIDPATQRILIIEYKRLRPGDGFRYRPCLCGPTGQRVQLRSATSALDAKTQLEGLAISLDKQGFHRRRDTGEACKTVKALLEGAKQQVCEYAAQILKRPEYADFHCTSCVVIHATTAEYGGRETRPSYTSVVGVWLQEG